MIKREVEFSYKGDRDYVQGPDIFNCVVAEIADEGIEDMKLSFHGLVTHNVCSLFVSDDEDELSSVHDVKAKGYLFGKGQPKYFALSESVSIDRKKVVSNYDEELIRNKAKYSDSKVLFSSSSEYSYMEVVVALTKLMHQKQFPEAKGKWIFTRLELQKNINNYSAIEIDLKHNFQYRLTKSEIVVDGEPVGFIYFSLVGK